MGVVTDNHNVTVESSEVEIWAAKCWGGCWSAKLQRVKCKVAKFHVTKRKSLITSRMYFLLSHQIILISKIVMKWKFIL